MLDTLDALLATIGVVFVLSLVVQAVQQIIKQLFSFKSRYMEKELLAMFGAEGPTFKGRTLKASALAAPIAAQFARWTGKNKHIVTIVDALKKKLAGFGYNDLSLLERISLPQFLKVLDDVARDLMPKAEDELKAALSRAVDDARQWYDFTLQAFQDHYERRMKLWAYVIGFVIVAMLNADAFKIYREFQSNRILRESAVKATEQLIASYKPPSTAGTQAPESTSLKELRGVVDSQLAIIDTLVSNRSFQLWRWDAPGRDTLSLKGPEKRYRVGYFFGALWRNFPGILVMTLLVGLGAPFWYDILKAVMGLKQRVQPTAGKSPGG